MTQAKRAFFGILICAVFYGMTTVSVANAETGREILDRIHVLNAAERGWVDCKQEMAITITDKRGNVRKRTLTLFTKKFPSDGEDARRTIVFFTAPEEVNGLGILQWSKPHGEDQQWLYLPELKRIRQISGGAKADSFAGTHLSYEDFSIISQVADWSSSDAVASIVVEGNEESVSAAVIDMVPTGKKVAYTKIRIKVRLVDSVIVRLQFFSELGVLKTVELEDIRTLGTIPTTHKINVVDERSRGHTEVVISNVLYNRVLPDDMFSQRSLDQGLRK